jgi:5-methylcytosine-specific restriction endonuclease McrA
MNLRRPPRPSGHCPLCDTWRESLHEDHIVPKFKGGLDTPNNKQYICANCHEDKTREDMTGRKLSEITKEKLRQRMLGKKHSLETRARISRALTGGPLIFGRAPQKDE